MLIEAKKKTEANSTRMCKAFLSLTDLTLIIFLKIVQNALINCICKRKFIYKPQKKVTFSLSDENKQN